MTTRAEAVQQLTVKWDRERKLNTFCVLSATIAFSTAVTALLALGAWTGVAREIETGGAWYRFVWAVLPLTLLVPGMWLIAWKIVTGWPGHNSGVFRVKVDLLFRPDEVGAASHYYFFRGRLFYDNGYFDLALEDFEKAGQIAEQKWRNLPCTFNGLPHPFVWFYCDPEYDLETVFATYYAKKDCLVKLGRSDFDDKMLNTLEGMLLEEQLAKDDYPMIDET